MNILVCLKQVPDTDDITWTKENAIDRTNLASILNPLDDSVIELAKAIKNKTNGTITAISMGPEQAKQVLSYAIARGVDNAVLLSDKKFSASDTWATAHIISTAIKELHLKPDIILCSNSASDGETGQTPAGIAQFLGLPYISCVNDVIRFYKKEHKLLVSQILNNKVRMIESLYPVLLSIKYQRDITPVKVFDYIKAQNTEISVYNANDINISTNSIGIMGSKTLVKKAYKSENERSTKHISQNEAVNYIFDVFSIKEKSE